MLENFQVGKATQERSIIKRFLVGLQSESQGYMCLEKTLCYYIIILGVLGTETEDNIHTHPYEAPVLSISFEVDVPTQKVGGSLLSECRRCELPRGVWGHAPPPRKF